MNGSDLAQQAIAAQAARLAAHGVPLNAVCHAAGVGYSTYWRWVTGRTDPQLSSWMQFAAVAERMIEERQRESA